MTDRYRVTYDYKGSRILYDDAISEADAKKKAQALVAAAILKVEKA